MVRPEYHYIDNLPIVHYNTFSDVTMGTVQLMANAETVTEKINCNNEAEKFTDCLPSSIYISGSNRVAGLICSTFSAFQNVPYIYCIIV